MSWDAVILRIRGPLRRVEELDDADYLPLGSRRDVVAAITAAFPAAEWEGATHLLYRRGNLSIEFAPEGHETVDSVMVEVRGEGDPITPLLGLVTRNGWVLLDTSTSKFIDPANPSEEGYAGYRRLLRGTGGRRPKRPRR